MVRNLHLFSLHGHILVENVKLKKNRIWHILQINWENVRFQLDDKDLKLPNSITVKEIK